jgi:glycosyltransferase involved in cell wall biosynthesis
VTRDHDMVGPRGSAAHGAEPLVSVGIPVYNGARYLREAIDSILGQTYANIELVISDNASTDDTEAICREYAARDPRVRYYRAERNHGAVWNFNRAFALARGELFMWQAFDDARHRECVARCVAELRARPDAVLCCAGVVLMDEDGTPVPDGEWPVGIPPVGPTPEARLGALARALYWYDFYGVARRSALERTHLCRPVWGFDVVLLLELCLLGPVVLAPGPLFRYRVFRRKSRTQVAATLSAPAVNAIPHSWTEFSLEMLRVIRRAPFPRARRRRLAAQFRRDFVLANRTVRLELTVSDVRAAAGRALRAARYGTGIAAIAFGARALTAAFAFRARGALERRLAVRAAAPRGTRHVGIGPGGEPAA